MARSSASELLQQKYFHDVEEMIASRLHAETESDAGRRELVRSTGIKDQRLIQELVDLGITSEGLIALRLLPLVMVAWAENRVDPKEHASIMEIAGQVGITDSSVAYILLERWLQHLPPAETVDAWKRLMHETTQTMSPQACKKLIHRMEVQMTQVAKSTGGIFGLGKVSKKEQQMIDGLLVALKNQLPQK
ncbi:hypothetical protein [Stieleria varia]|nr:hypothetical protein [Stieleria varia]